MKWLLLAIGVVFLIAVGGWYYLDNQTVVRRTNRREPGFAQSYTHEYRGTFLDFDTTSRTLRLRGVDGKDYLFSVPQPLIDNRDEGVVGNAVGQPLIVEWNDGRSPKQILSEYASDPERPLNAGTILMSIRRAQDEK